MAYLHVRWDGFQGSVVHLPVPFVVFAWVNGQGAGQPVTKRVKSRARHPGVSWSWVLSMEGVGVPERHMNSLAGTLIILPTPCDPWAMFLYTNAQMFCLPRIRTIPTGCAPA